MFWSRLKWRAPMMKELEPPSARCQLLRTCANFKIFTPSLRYFLSEIFISGIWKARCDYCYREIRFCGCTKDESKQDKTLARGETRPRKLQFVECVEEGGSRRRLLWVGVGGWVGGRAGGFSYIYMHTHFQTYTHAAAAGVSRASACVDQWRLGSFFSTARHSFSLKGMKA